MASEYLLKKAKEQNVEPKRELTPKEKRKNWWDYNKWFVMIGLAAIVFAGYTIWNSVFNAPPKPDYQIAYVGEAGIPEGTLGALESALAEKGQDLNGDGQVVVEIKKYEFSSQAEDPQTLMGNQARLIGDIFASEFFCYLMEDPASFQEQYGMLAYPDGRVPEEGMAPSDDLWLAWKDCPVLSEMDLGSTSLGGVDQEIAVENQRLLSELYIGRSVAMDGWEAGNMEGYAALWEAITEGAG